MSQRPSNDVNERLLQHILDCTRRTRPAHAVPPQDLERVYDSIANIHGLWPAHTWTWKFILDPNMLRLVTFRPRHTSPNHHFDVAERLTEYALKHILPDGPSLNQAYVCDEYGRRRNTFPQLLLWVAAMADQMQAMMDALDARVPRWREEIQDLWRFEYEQKPEVCAVRRDIRRGMHHRLLEAECQVATPTTRDHGLALFRSASHSTYISDNSAVYNAVLRAGVTVGDWFIPKQETVGQYLDREINSRLSGDPCRLACQQWR
ncbi:MAG: hypothetical protein CVV05_00905 [Gammaproteobacteria bacterium HGW-Gammaproteobacteria-1]|jgi:hypothetical protein|nr:MAG: hypothetical protein CVV05_00905 [Gammaproteobacteria bacterium HGW-Gammaproteobacteria-1]